MLSQLSRRPDNALFAAPKTIPFDYVFQIPLKGERGNKVQDVVEISTEGNFVALSIGYSLVPDERRSPRKFRPVINAATTPQSPVIIPCFLSAEEAFIFHGIIVVGMPDAEIAIVNFNANTTGAASLPSVEKGGIKLGSDGKIKIALPFTSAPILLQILDKTNNLLSRLFVFVSTNGVTPTIGPRDLTAPTLPAAGDDTVFVYGRPDDVVNVTVVNSTTTEGSGSFIIEDGELAAGEVEVRDAESGTLDKVFIGRTSGRIENQKKLSPGDTLLVGLEVEFGFVFSNTYNIPRPKANTITLEAMAIGLERIGSDLTRGFRLNPDFARFIDFPLDQLTFEAVENIFETGSVAATETSFLYSLDVSSTGREYQSKPIHNIAGLGIADGDRPFRPFAKPVMFEPRSSIRMQVEEITGPPGTLYIVLQGYKVLGSGRISG